MHGAPSEAAARAGPGRAPGQRRQQQQQQAYGPARPARHRPRPRARRELLPAPRPPRAHSRTAALQHSQPLPWSPGPLRLAGCAPASGGSSAAAAMGAEPLPGPGATSSGPRQARDRPAAGAGRRHRSLRPLRGDRGRCAACERCGAAAARNRQIQRCKNKTWYEATLPQLLRAVRQNRATGLCSMRLSRPCDHFRLPIRTGPLIAGALAGLTPAQGLLPARPSQANSSVLCLRMFSFGLADPLTSAGLNAI